MFEVIKAAVRKQFDNIAGQTMFIVDVEKDELFKAYLDTFADPVERQEHNCNCCRQFLNTCGHIVAIDPQSGKLLTLWDFDTPAPYAAVPSALRDVVLSHKIVEYFFSKEQKLGTDFNRQSLADGTVIRWQHFAYELPKAKVLTGRISIEEAQGLKRTTREVFARGLETITPQALDTVLELIDANTLYKGAEFRAQVAEFATHKRKYDKLGPKKREIYTWLHAESGGRVRNTMIGTLLVDLSEGVDLERAVRSYENKAAPANYKRPTALVTESMVKRAQERIEELGLTAALCRRHAQATDIPVTHLLHVNRNKAAAGNVFEQMAAESPVGPKTFAKAPEVSLDEFVTQVLPTASNVELLLENGHNFMSLIAPEETDEPEDVKPLFAWPNHISWTYQNNMADAIKQKVKAAGGKTDAELRVSLEWFNFDDLDLHVVEPNGNRIYFGHKQSRFSAGFLDVDMNMGYGTTREPVENIAWGLGDRIQEGQYRVEVNNYCKRENENFGFNVQVECQGNVFNLSNPKALPHDRTILVASFRYTKRDGITDFQSALDTKEGSYSVRELAGLSTGRFHKVNMAMWSPNHWTTSVGNKHLFMILDKANVEDSLRPFFNEYLRPELQVHGKVFEVLGSKVMVKHSPTQLSGVGFSLTQKTQFVVRVDGKKMYRVSI